jgi:outer membrane lipoprotein-sorting protein
MTAHIAKITMLILAAIVLASCASENNTVSIVETYLHAIVDNDVERLAELTCAEAESDAITAATSFKGTDAEIQGMQCSVSEVNEGYNIVECQGKIVVSYQAELREFPLSRYRVIQQDDVWRVCGEA